MSERNNSYWRKRRDEINDLLKEENNKPSIFDQFTIGFIDFSFKNYALNVHFIDYELVVDLAYKYQVSYAFDLFVSRFEDCLNRIKNEPITFMLIDKIRAIYNEELKQVIANKNGEGLLLLLSEFEDMIQESGRYKHRNVFLSYGCKIGDE